jgi:hypothetical protein
MATLTMTAAGRVSLKQDEMPAQAQQEQLTPDEEREARAFVEEFLARFEKTQDVTPLLNEMFVSDFAERLQHDDIGSLFPLALDPEIAEQATPEEIRRVYAASLNCLHLGMRLFIAASQKRKLEKAQRKAPETEEEERDFTIEELIPPSVIKLIQSDPLLARLLEKELQKEKANRASRPEGDEAAPNPEAETEANPDEPQSFDDLAPFKSLEQMRLYTAMTEQGLALIREHLKTLPPELTVSINDFWTQREANPEEAKTEQKKDLIDPRPHILTSPFMGYPEGTRMICANVLLFHMDMTRDADGHLKIVKVYLLDD